jgi:uncharacterized protein YyaL (SSP411 family)
MSNRLARETSPYLLQHAENPVDWYPWGEEALAKAREEDRPILLSIGYAACHWCHVMAHESFEDPATAAIMNEHFVNIKVDREERPDLDSIYMQAVQAMTGHGGWPMTVFLTPEGVPFYGGTYFPPVDRHGIPSFSKILHAVAEAYRNRRESVKNSAIAVREIYAGAESEARATGEVTEQTLEFAYRNIAQQYDPEHGGFGGAPKFPPTMTMDFLLRHWARTGTEHALEMARQTFIKMGRGGIYDQIGGGFARYSVDAYWLVPHFEKMLYDNALLVRFGAHLYQASKSQEVKDITEATVDWLAREMTSSEGGWYSSFDADSEGHEGKFYLWDESEIDTLLGDRVQFAKVYFGVTSGGNFEGRNILFVPTSLEVTAVRMNMNVDEAYKELQTIKQILYEARAQRVWPGRDEKIIASWNGLMLRGVLESAKTFSRDDFLQLGIRNAEFLAAQMVHNGRVLRTYKDGSAKIPGFLEDHAAVALGFLALFEQTLETKWFLLAQEITENVLQHFWDPVKLAFFDTADDAEQLITRPRDVTDNAIPSGTSLAVELLFRFATYTDNDEYRQRARFVLDSLASGIQRYPTAFGHLLGAAEYAVTFACHGEYCDMPSPRALDAARTLST